MAVAVAPSYDLSQNSREVCVADYLRSFVYLLYLSRTAVDLVLVAV